MSIKNVYVCDRCNREHRGDKPFSWQTSVAVTITAAGLPSYSPYAIKEAYEHLCEPCIMEVAKAVNTVLEKPTPASSGG